MEKNRPVILFAVLYTVCVTGARHLIILSSHAGNFNIVYLYKILLGSLTEFTIGFLLGAIIFTLKRRILSDIFFIIFVGITVLFGIVSFHYEAVFGRLPAADLFFYLGEVRYLSPSLHVNLPVPRVVIETGLIMALLYFAVWLLRKKANRKFPVWINAVTACIILASVAIQVRPSLLPDRYLWSSRQPLLWLAQSMFIKQSYRLKDLKLSEKDFAMFRQIHGMKDNAPVLDPDYPLCTVRRVTDKNGNGRNIILLILEGVNQDVMHAKFDNIELMPNLNKIAAENLMFKNFKAAGTKSAIALPAILSGLPGNPFNNFLWNNPMINMWGLPRELNRNGYLTSYFHGGDLSFEHQREYLRDIGMSEIHEYDPDGGEPVYGWGYDDGDMLQKVEGWVADKQSHGQKYFTTLFTLSTHDPYILPPTWQRRLQGGNKVFREFAETYIYLDQYLGEFYNWYKKNTDNTLLVITGDHAPHLVNEGWLANEYGTKFNVPLIIAGLNKNELQHYRKYQDEYGGMSDLPASLLDLLDLPPPNCDLGVSLFRPEDWSRDRMVYSFAGDSLENMYMWLDGRELLLDRVSKQIKEVNPGKKSKLKGKAFTGLAARAKGYINNMYPIDYYLLKENKYAPLAGNEKYKPIKGLARPLVVSHRGNVNGEAPPNLQNSSTALDGVLGSGFKWVEVDVQLTKDHQLVLFHDPYVVIDGKKTPLLELTLAELKAIPGYANVLTLEQGINKYSDKIKMLIEAKPQERIGDLRHLSREIVRLISSRPDRNRFIIDSFHYYLASSIKYGCKCQVGYDTPYKQPLSDGELRTTAKMKVDWIYVEYHVVDPNLIRRAHKFGLKVMAYTVDDRQVIDNWKKAGTLPDGIITDYDSIRKMLE